MTRVPAGGARAALLLALAAVAGCLGTHETRLYVEGVEAWAHYREAYEPARLAAAAEAAGWTATNESGQGGAVRLRLSAPDGSTLRAADADALERDAGGFVLGATFDLPRERAAGSAEAQRRADEEGPRFGDELRARVEPIERAADLAHERVIYRCACVIVVE